VSAASGSSSALFAAKCEMSSPQVSALRRPLGRQREQSQVWRGEQASWLAEGLPQIEHGLVDQLRAVQAEATRERSLHEQQIHKIKRERLKWAEKAMEGVVPADIARDKQQQLARQLAALEERSRQITTSSASQEEILRGTIALITDCASAYVSGGLQLRRTYNQAWFSKITVDAEHDDLAAEAEHTDLIESLHLSARALTEASVAEQSVTPLHTKPGESLSSRLVSYADGSIKNPLVELRGFEPLTPSMRTRCATGLRYSPKTGCQRSKLWHSSAPPYPYPPRVGHPHVVDRGPGPRLTLAAAGHAYSQEGYVYVFVAALRAIPDTKSSLRSTCATVALRE
jgi:hypothetical protein